MEAMMCHVQIDKQGKLKLPPDIGLPSGEAEVIFLFPESKIPNQLSKFAGSVSNKEAHEMMAIVKKGCERIEKGGW